MPTETKKTSAWLWLALTAAGVLAVTMGARQSLGLFFSPLNTATGLGIANISLAMAVGQFMWGAVQPVAGAVADHHGPGRVLAAGVMLLAASFVLTPFMHSTLGLSLVLGMLMACGSGAAAFSVLIGSVAQRVPAQHRGMVSGIINAGGSFGQFIFAPLVQGLIQILGWVGALWALAGITLAALPATRLLRRPVAEPGRPAAVHQAGGLRGALREAMRNRSYLWLPYCFSGYPPSR